MIDNYDSFVFNLVRYLEELGELVSVHRNDQITVEKIKDMKPQGIIISPGPKAPTDAGISLDIINTFKGQIPILGICLGHQAICFAFGANIIKGKEPVHGKISEITHDGNGLFNKVKHPLRVTRYHSLVVDQQTLPDCLEVTSQTKDDIVMGVRHKYYPIEGVQFHPEAELTECGHHILINFIKMCK